MHLLRKYTNYGDRGADAARWAMMLYNIPISLGIDYFVNNLKGRETSEIYFGACGFIKNKAKSKN